MRMNGTGVTPLFRSQTQMLVLGCVLQDDQIRTITQIAAQTNIPYPTVHREITRLKDAEILTVDSYGKASQVQANNDNPLVAPLREILRIVAGPVPLLKRYLSNMPGIDRAFIYGSFAARAHHIDGPPPADIDVMVIGAPDTQSVYDVCDSVEERIGKPVNPTILTPNEYERDTGFLTQVRSQPTIELVGAAS